MPSARVEVIQTVLPGDEPADQAINTLHFNSGTDWQALATYVMEAFSGQVFGPGGPFSQYVQRKMEVRTYDIADPKPRPVKASATFTPAPWTGDTLGPRLLACCLSFYATRNLPRIRGRIYIGPFVGTVCSHEEIPAATMTNILALGETLHQGVAGWQHIKIGRAHV